jgi:hypothetical protein
MRSYDGQNFIIIYTSFLFSCAANTRAIDMNAKELMKVLALSNFIELNKIETKFEKDLILSMYEMPAIEENDCFPESHGVCAYDYCLAVSQYDEDPEYNVFKIGRFGQIAAYKWIKEDRPDYAEIELLINKYSSAALEFNKQLVNVPNASG